ncbi:hypothetical protein BPUM_0330 [Bacillus pumilus SAFR-032]|uniref:Uncharacterized protein n=1 Tax=Bacillus pumilus (strain SAFR-032) TaxID=315750 RepID=A8F9W0_BACP2|nr:hypothetical protein BPUM_0330 [Bacillus pumilus SAFR-032]
MIGSLCQKKQAKSLAACFDVLAFTIRKKSFLK